MSEASSIISIAAKSPFCRLCCQHRKQSRYVRSQLRQGTVRLFADGFGKSEKCGNQILFLVFTSRPESRSISMQSIYSFRVFFCNFSRKNFLRIHPSSGGFIAGSARTHVVQTNVVAAKPELPDLPQLVPGAFGLKNNFRAGRIYLCLKDHRI